jgi:hypothetical protein
MKDQLIDAIKANLPKVEDDVVNSIATIIDTLIKYRAPSNGITLDWVCNTIGFSLKAAHEPCLDILEQHETDTPPTQEDIDNISQFLESLGLSKEEVEDELPLLFIPTAMDLLEDGRHLKYGIYKVGADTEVISLPTRPNINAFRFRLGFDKLKKIIMDPKNITIASGYDPNGDSSQFLVLGPVELYEDEIFNLKFIDGDDACSLYEARNGDRYLKIDDLD